MRNCEITLRLGELHGVLDREVRDQFPAQLRPSALCALRPTATNSVVAGSSFA